MERRLQLQPRLQLLADMVPEGCRLADVGTDHGYLPVYLLQRRRIRGAVAADIGAEPLAHARRTAEAYGVTGIDFRLCDGLRDIAPDEVDTVVIAGMGGETIIAILEGAISGLETLQSRGIDTITFTNGTISVSFSLAEVIAKGASPDIYRLTLSGGEANFTLADADITALLGK